MMLHLDLRTSAIDFAGARGLEMQHEGYSSWDAHHRFFFFFALQKTGKWETFFRSPLSQRVNASDISQHVSHRDEQS
jgi:hypothetical protein